jgi:AcrR family transcriptional regulator
MTTQIRRKRHPLTRERIVDVALGMARDLPLDDVSLHKVGAALDVSAMSLYRYVDSKADLLDAMGDAVLGEIEIPEPSGGDWRTDLRSLALAFRRALQAHPNVAQLVLTRRINAPGALPMFDAALAILARAGLPPADAVDYVRAAIAFEIGAQIQEHSLEHDAGATASTTIEAEAFPYVVDAAAHLQGMDHERVFEQGLELVIAGIEARLPDGAG